MRRRGRRAPALPREGDIVIDGHVRARLLGMKLLDLDAHVVVGTASAPIVAGADTGVTRGALAPPPPGGGRAPIEVDGDRAPARDPRSLPLARARELLTEGTTVLAAARRIR